MDNHEESKEAKVEHSMPQPKPKTTIAIKKDHLFYGLAIVMLVIGLAGGYFLHDITGAGGGTPTQTQDNDDNGLVKVTIDANDPVLGNSNAPLTIIEFSDLSCPYCAAAVGQNEQVIEYLQSRDSTWQPAVPNIIKDYVNTGKVKLVFKYFPGHGSGAEAMEMALCANEQGKFWEVSDLFFANQESMENVIALEELASSISGLDAQKLKDCYENKKYENALQEDMQAGLQAGVGGTPAFLLGNDKDGYVAIVGAQPYEVFKQAIDAALA